MDKTLLMMYSRRLDQENEADVVSALRDLQEKPRQEGESAWPDIGTILAAVDVQRRTRIVRQSNQDEERLVRWQCSDCGITKCGFVKYGESRVRYCPGIPKKQHYAPGEICGKLMLVVADLPAKAVMGR